MKILIVYDSYFGNTEKIAQKIGASLGAEAEVELSRSDSVKLECLAGVDLLIVGSPTRAFRPTKGVIGFMNNIHKGGLQNTFAAAFDTRISTADVNSRFLNAMVKRFGYAADPIAEKLKKKGGDLVIPPEGFFVKDTEGPLKEGELVRAADWAWQVLSQF